MFCGFCAWQEPAIKKRKTTLLGESRDNEEGVGPPAYLNSQCSQKTVAGFSGRVPPNENAAT